MRRLNLSDLLLLLIHAHDDKLEGRTLVQKLVYLLVNVVGKIQLSQRPRFRAGLYGPYSRDVASELSKLIALDFLSETTETTSTGNLIYIYHMTKDGKEVVQEIVNKYQEEYELIKDFVDRIKHMKIDDLIAASKVHYIIEENQQLLGNLEALIRKAENYGWDIGLNEAKKGLEILRNLEND